MGTHKLFPAAIMVLVGSFLLTGCSNGPSPAATLPSVADAVERGMPNSLTDAELAVVPREVASVLWLEEGIRFALITWGSSSCPTVVTAMSAVADEALELRLTPSNAEMCTADMAPTTHEFTLPDSVSARPVQVVLNSSAEGLSAELTLP